MPLLDATLREHGVEAPVTAGLRTLLEGRTTPDDWVADLPHPRAQPPLPPCRLS